MEIKEGGTRSFSSDFRLNELVLIDETSPTEDTVYAVSESLLQSKEAAIIDSGKLPFTLKVNFGPMSL